MGFRRRFLIYLLVFLLVLLTGDAIRLSLKTSSHGHLYLPGYGGTNITRIDWVGEYIGIKDNQRYAMWNYEQWNSIEDYTMNSGFSDQFENMLYVQEDMSMIDLSTQIDVAWSQDFKFLAQAFTYSDIYLDVVYIRNSSNLYYSDPVIISFQSGDLRSINWGMINGSEVLFIGTKNGEIWSWSSNDIARWRSDKSVSILLEYQIENNGSIDYIDVNTVESSIITSIHSNEKGDEIHLLNSSNVNIHSINEIAPISQGKWSYGSQMQYYYSVAGVSDVYFIAYNEEILVRVNYHIIDFPVIDPGSFRFSFSDSFKLFGILVDNKIQIFNITSSNPTIENLIFEYYEEGVPIDSFAIHPSLPLIVFNKGLPNLSSNERYDSEIVVANVITNNFEYILVPSVYVLENEYPPIEMIYGINYSIIMFLIILNELNIRHKLRKKEKFALKRKIISERAESLYPKS